MHVKTNVSLENGKWEIQHTFDEAAVMRQCMEERNSGREGDIEGGKAKVICRIPRHRFYSDFELQMYQEYKGRDDIEANKWLNIWMYKNPQFRTTTGGRKSIL